MCCWCYINRHLNTMEHSFHSRWSCRDSIKLHALVSNFICCSNRSTCSMCVAFERKFSNCIRCFKFCIEYLLFLRKLPDVATNVFWMGFAMEWVGKMWDERRRSLTRIANVCGAIFVLTESSSHTTSGFECGRIHSHEQ